MGGIFLAVGEHYDYHTCFFSFQKAAGMQFQMTDAFADGIKKSCIGSGLNALKQMLIISSCGRDRNRKLNDIIKNA
jgi:hypothetical protein